MTWRTVTVVIATVGLIPGVWFLVTWLRWAWPPRAWPPRGWVAAVDAVGWVLLLMALHCYVLWSIPAGEWFPPHTIGHGIARVLVGVAIDALLFLRAVRWYRIRRRARSPEGMLL